VGGGYISCFPWLWSQEREAAHHGRTNNIHLIANKDLSLYSQTLSREQTLAREETEICILSYSHLYYATLATIEFGEKDRPKDRQTYCKMYDTQL
jgi:hypothetical protein